MVEGSRSVSRTKMTLRFQPGLIRNEQKLSALCLVTNYETTEQWMWTGLERSVVVSYIGGTNRGHAH